MRDTMAPSLASTKAPSARVTESTVGMAMGMPPTIITSMLVRVGQLPVGGGGGGGQRGGCEAKMGCGQACTVCSCVG